MDAAYQFFMESFQRSLTFVRGSASPSSGPHCTMGFARRSPGLPFDLWRIGESEGRTKMSLGNCVAMARSRRRWAMHSRRKHRPARRRIFVCLGRRGLLPRWPGRRWRPPYARRQRTIRRRLAAVAAPEWSAATRRFEGPSLRRRRVQARL